MTALSIEAFPLGCLVTHDGCDAVTDDIGPVYTVTNAELCCVECRHVDNGRSSIDFNRNWDTIDCQECGEPLAAWRS